MNKGFRQGLWAPRFFVDIDVNKMPVCGRLRRALREQAEGEGHSVDWAARLDEASDALATTGFDLILLDLMLNIEIIHYVLQLTTLQKRLVNYLRNGMAIQASS